MLGLKLTNVSKNRDKFSSQIIYNSMIIVDPYENLRAVVVVNETFLNNEAI